MAQEAPDLILRRQLAEIAASPVGPQIAAFFDLDGTLVDGFTAVAQAKDRIKRRQARIGEIFGVIEAATRYRLGRMQFERLIIRAAGYLRGDSLADLDVIGERLFGERIAEQLYPRMGEIVVAHRARGHTLVLCSSALTIHVEPVARHLRIPHVLCNHFEVDEHGALTGRLILPVVWGKQKAVAAQEFSAANGIEIGDSYFYADGDEERALMCLVGHPRPVNPRPMLAAMAAERGWPVLRMSISARPGRRCGTTPDAPGYPAPTPGARTTMGTAGK